MLGMSRLLLLLALTLAAQTSPKGAAYSVKDPGVTAPIVIQRTEPQYSDDARTERISGKVTLTTVISSEGKPEEIAVQSPLFPSLDANAMQALAQWRFVPGRKDDQPVRVKAVIEFHFEQR